MVKAQARARLEELYAELAASGRLSVDFAHLGREKELPSPAVPSLRDRFRGALLGGAVGDALGRSLEFAGYPHPRWIEYYEPERGYSGSPVGRITDIGIATAEFVDRYRRGLRWTDAGVKSAGNGVAMRSAPVGLFWPDDYPSLKLGPASRRCSRTTTRWRSPAGS